MYYNICYRRNERRQTKNYVEGWNSWNDVRNGTYGRGLERYRNMSTKDNWTN